MPTKINQYTPAEFPDGKEPVIKKFLGLIFDNVENYEEFQLYALVNKLGLTDHEKRQFNEVLDILRNELKKNERIEVIKGTLLRMLPENDKDVKSYINIENYIGGNNNGIQSSKGDFNGNIKEKIVINDEKKSGKKILLEMLAWIVGIIAGVIAIYEFIIKNLW